MSWLTLVLWLGNVLLDTLGQLSFKVAATRENHAEGLRYWLNLIRNPWIMLGLGCFVGEFVLWLAFLSLVDLSEGVLLGSINIVAVMVAGRIFFHEHLTRLRLVGIGMVALGVAIVGAGA